MKFRNKKTICAKLKVQSIRSRGKKHRPYVYISAEMAGETELGHGSTVEWELLDIASMRLNKVAGTERADCPMAYPLRMQAIKSKIQKARLYVYIPVPLAAAMRIEHGDPVRWEYDGKELILIIKAKTS
jgi:hypothetical protein